MLQVYVQGQESRVMLPGSCSKYMQALDIFQIDLFAFSMQNGLQRFMQCCCSKGTKEIL